MYYGQFELDKVLNEEIFKDAIGGFFMECGAYDGIEESTCYSFERNLVWTGINIEPVPKIFEKLCKNRPSSINLNVALSNTEKKAIFKQPIHPHRGIYWGNGSLIHTKDHLKHLHELGVKEYETYTVQCVSYAYLYFTGKIHRVVDLFILDVEGHELEVLDGVFRLSPSLYPRVCCIEHTLCGYNPLVKKMTEYGYEMVFQYKNNTIFRKHKDGSFIY